MPGSFIVGIAPAAPSAAPARPGFAAAGETADAAGIFGALVDLLGQAAPGAGLHPTSEHDADSAPALPAPPEAGAGPAAPVGPEDDDAPTVENLVDSLTELVIALDAAPQPGEAVDPAQLEKLSGVIDALAGLLGVPLPSAAPEASPPPSEPMVVEVTGGLRRGATTPPGSDIPAPPLPRTGEGSPTNGHSAPTAAPVGNAAPPASIPAALAARVETPQVVALPQPAPTPASAAAAPPSLVDPASPLGRLVEKMSGLARALDARAPNLAKRLDALVQRLGSGETGAPLPAGPGPDRTGASGLPQAHAALARVLGAVAPVSGEASKMPAVATAPRATSPSVAPPPVPAAPAPSSPTSPQPGSPDAEFQAGAVTHATPDRPPEHDTVLDPAPPTRTGTEARAAATGPDAAAEPAAGRPAPPQPAIAAAAPPTATAIAAAAVAGTEQGVPVAYQPPGGHRISLPQVAFEVVRQVQAGNSRFQIRLDPPELGRVDVKLDVDQSGNINARMTVERAETLDLMQRDHRALERALAQAGLDGARTNLEFSLRQNPFTRHEGGDGRGREAGLGGGSGGDGPVASEDAPEGPRALYRGSLRAGGINLFV